MEGLIRLRDKDGTKLSDDEVVDSILALVVGGFESSAISMTWALYYLAKYPKILEKVQVDMLILYSSHNNSYVYI